MNQTTSTPNGRFRIRRGFLLCLLGFFLVLAGFLWWAYTGLQGGAVGHSPDGKYTLTAMGPLQPRPGGTYDVELLESESGVRMQTLSITVADDEIGPALRGQTEIVWSEDGATVTLKIAGSPQLTLYLPGTEETGED